MWNPFRKKRRPEPETESPAAEPGATEAEPVTGGNTAMTETADAIATVARPAPAAPPRSAEDIQQHVVDVLRTVYDPEIPVDIYELGLVYEVKVAEGGHVDVIMTLTSPACPVAGTLPPEVEEKVAGVPGVTGVNVELTWEPPWGPDKMSEAARLQLGM